MWLLYPMTIFYQSWPLSELALVPEIQENENIPEIKEKSQGKQMINVHLQAVVMAVGKLYTSSNSIHSFSLYGSFRRTASKLVGS